MTKIIALDPQTNQTLGRLNNRGNRLFFLDKHIQEFEGEHSFTFTMPSNIREAQYFGKRGRFIIPSEENGFEEFLIFHSVTTSGNQKIITGTAAYTEMETAYIVEPGSYAGTLQKLANIVLPYTKYDLGVFEDIRTLTIQIEEHIGAYSFLLKLAKLFELEMSVRVETSGTRFTGRFVNFVKRIGPDLKKEVEYGKDLIAVKVTEHSDRIATKLLGIGPVREDGTYLTSTIVDEDAYQRWNDQGEHITRIYIPETNDQNMTQERLDQLTRTELNKRIASVMEYEITAASIESAYPVEKVRFGSTLRIKNPKFDPPLFADARVIGVRRSIVDKKEKTYTIGEVKTYSEEDIYKTFRQLQEQYNLRVIRSAEKPPGSANKIWIQITPGSSMEIPHVWSTELNDWVKIAPSTAAEIGAETPEGAQDKADESLRLAREDISGVQGALDSLEVGINTTFADGIIEEAEARAIETYLNTIGTEKVSVDNRYTAIYSDVLLTGTVKSTLAEAKTLFNIAHADLTGSIRMAISDGRTTATEKADVEAKFTAYRTRLATLATTFETAGSAIASAKAAVATEDAKDYTDDQLSSFVPFVEYTNKLAELQSQIDGSVMTWFEFGQPTAQNYPALEWTTEEMRNIHLGDVYYDRDTGFAYRYTIEQGVHTWTDLKDSDVTKALQDAAEAKDTADGKRRVFIALPIPPYDPGDLWTQGAGGDILRCVKQKIIGQVYAASDWQKAAKYTDDTRAVQAEENAKDHADQRSTEIAAEVNQTIQQTRINLETELAAKAGLNYVDGQFNLVDSELNSMLGNINLITGDVSGITSRIDGLQATSSDLQSRVALNEDALLASNGRMTTFETDVNELEGTMATTITQLSNFEGTITNQQTQIDANATAITLKASQNSLDTLTGEVSELSAELSVQVGQIALKASASELTTVDDKVTGLQSDVSLLTVNLDGITLNVTSLQSDLDELGSTVTDVHQFASNIDQKADSIIFSVNALTQTVDGNTTSISNAQSSISQLSNSVALKATQTQVDLLAGNVSSVSTQLASLEVSVSGISTVVSSKVSQAEIDDSIAIAKSAKDTRDTNEEPQFYWSNYKRQTVEEFKRRTVLGVTGMASYGYLTTEVPWSDSSGGQIIQRFSSTDGTFERRSASNTSWGAWIQVETTAGAQEKVDGLKTVEINPLKIRVTSSESSITQLSNSIALKASQSSMDSLTGRMNSAESALTVQDGQISSKVSTTDFNGNKLVSLINQTATTVDIDASRINLIGAVTVLSDITGQLGNITAGTIDGVTFKSGTGTSRSFTLASGMAEFIEKDSQSGVEVLTRTTLNNNALAITNSISGEVYYSMQLRADSLLFDTQGGIAEYAHDRILLHRGKASEIAMYANTFASSIISTNTLQLSGKGQTLSIEDETLRYNGSPIGFSGSDLLWSGGVFMQASQSIAPSRLLSDCPNGWLLIWGRYVNGSVSNSDWNFTMIPKRYGVLNGGSWHILGAANVNDAIPPVAYKYLYATNTTITGHDRNKSGTESGQVLRYVVAY